MGKSIKFSIRAFPIIRFLDELGISILSDKLYRLFILFVFDSTFILKTENYFTSEIIWTISTGLQIFFLKAAQFNFASSLINVPFTSIIPQFTTSTQTPGRGSAAGFTISPAASNFSYQQQVTPELSKPIHIILLKMDRVLSIIFLFSSLNQVILS